MPPVSEKEFDDDEYEGNTSYGGESEFDDPDALDEDEDDFDED